ncbi:MAG: UbiD family decarboxylase [Candidatus Tectomicrobia bacterium]|nr:UbiD family decarboxylase [Candidatus Tectomicrobia bacterium]
MLEKDLRTFLEELEAHDMLRVVQSPVDPATEMGALFDQSDRPILFENVRGYEGWRVCGELMTKRESQALALGCDPRDVVRELVRRYRKGLVPFEIVGDGPCKEVVWKGDDVDLLRLPVIKHSEKDGGRTIGAGMNYTRDRETGIGNLAMLRMEVQDRNHTGTLLVPRHTYRHFEQYEAAGEDMPMAVPIGHHPLIDVAVNWTVPYGVDEFELAGALLESPIPMVRCETLDLVVPARAEIVIEGKLLAGVRRREGPFGEFQCSYASGTGENPVFEVSAVTMRRDAIYRHCQATNFVEHQSLNGLPMEAHLYERLREVGGYADVHDVHCAPCGGQFVILIQMTPHYEGEVKNILMGALSSAYLHPKVAIAVDEDVDIHKPEEILWAVGTRFNPATGVVLVEGTRNHPMDVSLPQISPPGARWQRVGGKIGIDACRPSTFRREERETLERTVPQGQGRVFLKELEVTNRMSRRAPAERV